MVVKWFNYFQVSASTSELSLLCFFDRCDFYPHDSFKIQRVMCETWHLEPFSMFNDLIFQKKQVDYHWKENSICYLWDTIRLEKVVLLSFIYLLDEK